MKIVACYITKNEGRNLGKSLSALKDQVDEILVVDTGSTDDTKSVAKSYHATVYDFPWRNDFAAARNFTLDQVVADWVVFLDADEYFSEETGGNLRRVLADTDSQGKDLLILSWRNIDEDTGEILLDSHVPRIFRGNKGFRYLGRIHEELRDHGRAIASVGVVSPEDLLLIHTGYSHNLTEGKARRNLGMLLEELKERKEDPGNLYMYLAETYMGIDDETNAAKYAELDVEQGRRRVVYASRSWRILLRQYARDPAKSERRRVFAAKAVKDFPELPEFHAEYAQCLALSLDFPGALREAEVAEKCFRNYKEQPGLEPLMFDDKMLDLLKSQSGEWKKLADRSKEIRLTSCLVVRDGEEDMVSWLKNTAVFSHERIVVDTGSEDRTRELAMAAGCRVSEIPWENDFAGARNQALHRATGEWIAVLDVDEAFDKPEQVKPFLAWLENSHPEAEAVIVPWVNIDRDRENREISRDRVLRLLRGGRGLRYEGNVHEQLCRQDGSSPTIYQEGQRLLLWHWGYSSERILAKARRNLALLQEDIALHGESPRHYRYLADSFSTLGDWEAVLLYAQKAMEAPLQSLVPDSRMEHLLLVTMDKLDRPFSEQEAVLRKFCEKFSEKPEFYGLLGILLSEQGRYEEGVPFLEEALKREENALSKGIPSDFADERGRVYAWLALIYGMQGRKEEEISFLEKAIADAPMEDEVLNIAREIKEELSPREFFLWLRSWIPQSLKGDLFLARWAERNGHVDLRMELQETIAHTYGRELPRTEYYRAATEGRSEGMEAGIFSGIRRDISFLSMVLFQLEREEPAGWQELERQCSELLPMELRRTWRAYRGRGEAPARKGFDALWPWVRTVGDTSQKERFALLSFDLGEDLWRSCGRDLLEDESWEAAFSLYSHVSAEDAETDGEFWHDLGIALWHLGENAAMECFSRARELGIASKDMDAYEAWWKEDGVL